MILLLLLCQLILRRSIAYVDNSTGHMIVPDFLLLAVVIAGLGRGVLWGVVTGFLLGLVQDSFAPVNFGVNAFSKVLIGFISGLIGGRVFLHTGTIVFFLIAGLKLLNDSFAVGFGSLKGYEGLASQLLIYTPASALYTSILGLLLLWISSILKRGTYRLW